MLITSKQLKYAVTELQFLLSRLRSRQKVNILGRVCMNLKIHAYNLESELQILLSRLRSRQNLNILVRVFMNLKIHAYNLETVIVRCNGATIFVIALTFLVK